jgi:hypothetical protein
MNYYNLYLKYKKKYLNLKKINNKYNLLNEDDYNKSFLFNHIFLSLLSIFDEINKYNYSYLFDGYITIFGGSVIKYYLLKNKYNEISEEITTDMDITILFNNSNSDEENFMSFYDAFNDLFKLKYAELNIRYEYINGLYIIYINDYQIIDINIYNINTSDDFLINLDLSNSMKEYAIVSSENENSLKSFYINIYDKINTYIFDNNYVNEYDYMLSSLLFEKFSIIKGINNMIEYFESIQDKRYFIIQYEQNLIDTNDTLNILKYNNYKKEITENYISNKINKLLRYIFKILLMCKLLEPCDDLFYNYLDINYYESKLDRNIFEIIKNKVFSIKLFNY